MAKKAWARPDSAALEALLAAEGGSLAGVMLRLAWRQGLSRDELRQLTWNDVSFSGAQILLPDRMIPLEAETAAVLRERYELWGSESSFVVPSERDRGQLTPESISRLARRALDGAGLTGVSLVDLRKDFIIRQLAEHDWPYAARVSGVSAPTLYAKFAPYMTAGQKSQRAPEAIDEFRLWKVLQSEGRSQAGLTLWMTWKMGLSVKEILALTWDQVDFERNIIRLEAREVPIGSTLRRLLWETWEENREVPDRHVLLTPNSRRPLDQPRLSKLVRTALIRGGIENLTLRDLNKEERHEREDSLLLRYAMEKGSISRREAMELLGLQKVAAYERLRRLTEEGRLTRIGGKYYLTGTVVPPEEQYEVLRRHLEGSGGAYRQELAEVLQVGPRQCSLILRHLVEEGRLVQRSQRYYLPQEEKPVASQS